MNSWQKIKHYPHIGLPIHPYTQNNIFKLVQDKDYVSRYAFLPLIHREKISYRYKADSKNAKKKRKEKKRELYYASHIDSLIYSYYASLLIEKYEAYVTMHNISDNAIAYRHIPKIEDGIEKGKCNIDFAKESFDFIKSHQSQNNQLSVIISDITSFFDSLDHKILKDSWRKVSSEDTLPADEYNVFKSVINYSYVEEVDLFKLFKDQIICQSPIDKRLKKKKLKKSEYMRDRNAIAYCKKEDISLIRKKKLIHSNKFNGNENQINHIGIPQGLPISAVLANIYMIEFDFQLAKFASEHNGYYRRYSDDIILICPNQFANNAKELLIEKIKEVKLDISPDKTKEFKIETDQLGTTKVYQLIKDDKGINKKPSIIEYLGFSFNGSKILLKNKCVSNYYLKMHKTIHFSEWMAQHINNETKGRIFENKLLMKFTPIGSKGKRVLRYNKQTGKQERTGKKTYGNFWAYVYKASRIIGNKDVIHQLSNNRKILKGKIDKAKIQVAKAEYKNTLDSLS